MFFFIPLFWSYVGLDTFRNNFLDATVGVRQIDRRGEREKGGAK